MAKSGSNSDIRAGGAFVELYLKGGNIAEKALEGIAKRAQSFSMTMEMMGKISSLSFGRISISAKAMADVVNRIINGVTKSSQRLVSVLSKTMSGVVKSIPKTMKSIGGSMTSMGYTALFAGMAGAGSGIRSMAVFGEYERQMSRVQALSGATGVELLSLADKAKELGRTTEFTASQAAEGLAYLAMAGLKAEDQLAAIPVVLDVATAAMMDLGRAADIITDVGMAFGYMGDQTVRVADVLATAATNSNTNIELMGHSFKYLAAFANNAGQSIEDMASTVALLAGMGIKGSTAGTGTREALIALVTGPKRSLLERMTGVKIADEAGNVKPLLDIIKELKVALATAPQDQKLGLLTQIFGKRGGNVVLSLMQRTNEEIDRMRGLMIGADGAAKRMADTMRDNLWGSWKALVSAAEAVQIALGEALTPAVRGFLDMMTTTVREISLWVTANKDVAVSLAMATAGILAAGAGLVAFGKILTTLAVITGPVFSAISIGVGLVGIAVSAMVGLVGAVLTGVITLIASLPGVVMSVVMIITGLASAMALSLMLTAVAGKTFVSAFFAVTSAIIIFVKSAWTASVAMGAVVKSMYATAKAATFVGTALATIGASAIGIINVIVQVKMAIISAFAQIIAFLPAILIFASIITAAMAALYFAFNAAVVFVKQLYNAIIIAGKSLVTAAYNIAASIGKAFVDSFKVVAGSMSIIGNALVGWFKKNRDSLLRFVDMAKQSGKELVSTFNAVVAALTSGNIDGALNIVWLEIKRRIIDAEILARKAFDEIVKKIPDIIRTLGEAMGHLISGLKNVFSVLFADVMAQFKIFMNGLETAVYTALSGVPGIGKDFSGAKESAESTGRAMRSRYENRKEQGGDLDFQPVINGISNAVSNGIDEILKIELDPRKYVNLRKQREALDAELEKAKENIENKNAYNPFRLRNPLTQEELEFRRRREEENRRQDEREEIRRNDPHLAYDHMDRVSDLRAIRGAKIREYVDSGMSKTEAVKRVTDDERRERMEDLQASIIGGRQRISQLQDQLKDAKGFERAPIRGEISLEEGYLKKNQNEYDRLQRKARSPSRTIAETMERMMSHAQRVTSSKGTFSATEILGGGMDRPDDILSETEKTNTILESINNKLPEDFGDLLMVGN